MSDALVAPGGSTVADVPVMLVRLREGVYASGKAVEPSRVDSLARVVHVVARESDLGCADGVVACCGAGFAPGTLEIVPWGELWPHAVCVRYSPVSRAVLEDAFHAGEKPLRGADDDEMDRSFQVAERIMGVRSDWVSREYADDWAYTTSFNGALAGDRRFPRMVDVGLEWLTAELVRPHVFRINSCGVRDGCPKHLIHAETFSLEEVSVLQDRLVVHELWASSIDLQVLAWCLIFGECAKEKLEFSVI